MYSIDPRYYVYINFNYLHRLACVHAFIELHLIISCFSQKTQTLDMNQVHLYIHSHVRWNTSLNWM